MASFKNIFLLIFLFSAGLIQAQGDPDPTDEEIELPIQPPPEVVQEGPDSLRVFDLVEVEPEFPGGEHTMYEFLGKNTKYPMLAAENGTQGTVYVQFVVEKDGSISNIQILRGIGGGCDQETIRVVKSMPNWSPGMQRGKPVRVMYNLPVKFTLN